jgi:hypothetical protein
VLANVVEGLGERFGFPVGPGERDILASSVGSWPPFPDTVDALRTLGTRYRLAVVSNIDDDLFTTTAPHLGIPFDCVVTAQQARSYKPDRAIFELALARLGVTGQQVAHVAEGVTEITPARRLGSMTIWVRRRGRSARLLAEGPTSKCLTFRLCYSTSESTTAKFSSRTFGSASPHEDPGRRTSGSFRWQLRAPLPKQRYSACASMQAGALIFEQP